MRIIEPEQHRVLAFVDACTRSGYRPTLEEVKAWSASPRPRRGYSKPGPNSITTKVAKFSEMLAHALGPLGEWVPEETSIDHLIRIFWIRNDNGLRLTRLGEAMLAEAQRVKPADESTVVILRSTDRFAYARLVGQLASVGEAFLVDPYFRLDQLETIFESTGITRILISKQYKGSSQARAGLRAALPSLISEAPIEIRASPDQALHDRMLIAETGDVFMLGASLNTVGVANTVFMRVPEPAAAALRTQVEDLWQSAEVVGRTVDDQHAEEFGVKDQHLSSGQPSIPAGSPLPGPSIE